MQEPRILSPNKLYGAPEPDMELRVIAGSNGPGRIKLSVARSTSAGAEANLQQQISAEVQARKDADAAEVSARQKGDADEASARAVADTQERNERIAADSAEATARQNADTAETGARIAADAQEKSERQAADAQEKTDRIAADNAEAQTRATADATEASTRAAADTALGNRITAVEGRIVPFVATLVLPGGLSILVGKSTRTVAIAGLRKNDNLVVTPNAALPANISMGEAYCLADGTLTVVLLNTALLALSISTTQNIPLGVIALRP